MADRVMKKLALEQADAMFSGHRSAQLADGGIDQFLNLKDRCWLWQRIAVHGQVQVAVTDVTEVHAAVTRPALLKALTTQLGEVADLANGQTHVEIQWRHAQRKFTGRFANLPQCAGLGL